MISGYLRNRWLPYIVSEEVLVASNDKVQTGIQGTGNRSTSKPMEHTTGTADELWLQPLVGPQLLRSVIRWQELEDFCRILSHQTQRAVSRHADPNELVELRKKIELKFSQVEMAFESVLARVDVLEQFITLVGVIRSEFSQSFSTVMHPLGSSRSTTKDLNSVRRDFHRLVHVTELLHSWLQKWTSKSPLWPYRIPAEIFNSLWSAKSWVLSVSSPTSRTVVNQQLVAKIIRDKPTTGNGLMLQSILLIRERAKRTAGTDHFADHIPIITIRQACVIENLWLTSVSQQSIAPACLVQAMWINNWPPESHDYLGSIALVLDEMKDELEDNCSSVYYFLPTQKFTLNQASFDLKDYEFQLH
ncbi:uncharacterized protein DEA37_0003537 [Paragonimus westermani]|uniref:Uncharacterized protein n=1 Tax=Paragonimus westermani TaxID=34504 RepID=A0A5J4NX33_9TREM|nr:uncharacterized protein DEA37_0003537 [Paragonimus westermani]